MPGRRPCPGGHGVADVRGYTVAQSRPSLITTKQRLRDSWFTDDDPEPGARSGSRGRRRLARAPAGAGCVVALPWADADIDAVARTEDEWLFREATQRGTEVLREELGVEPVPNVVIPSSGYITEQAAPSLGWADQSVPVDQAWEASVATREPQITDNALESPVIPDHAGAPTPAQPVRAIVADNSVWGVPQSGAHAHLAPGVTATTFPAALGSLLAATGPAPQTTGYSNPDWRFDYRLDSVTAAPSLPVPPPSGGRGGDAAAEWAQSPELVRHWPRVRRRHRLHPVPTVTELYDARAARPVPC